MLSISEGMDFLNHLIKSHKWGYDLAFENNKYIVYTHKMDKEILDFIPNSVAGKQVVVHFANYKNASKEKYFRQITVRPKIIPGVSQIFESEDSIDIDELLDALDRLEYTCGLNVLRTLFFEVHDGKNAITNLSLKFPLVRNEMAKLYDKYGFDVIYDELGD